MMRWFSRTKSSTPPAVETAAAGASASSVWFDALHVFALTSFAISQPLYDRLSERPVFLVDLHVGAVEILTLAAVMAIGLPALLVGVEWLILACSKIAYRKVHALIVCVLLFLCCMPIVKMIPQTIALSFSTGAVAAVVATWLYFRVNLVRQLITFAAVGIVIFPTVFLVHVRSGMSSSLPPTSRSAEFSPAPIVMLVLDEFCGSALMNPERQIDEHRFPNFAALSREATWFRNASAVHHFTEQAVPAIFTGHYPSLHSMPFPAQYPQQLFSILRFTGSYEQAAFEPVTRFAGFTQAPAGEASNFVSRMTYIMSTLGRVYLFHVSPHDFGPRLPEIPRPWFGLAMNGLSDDVKLLRGTFRYPWGNRRDLQFEHFLRCIDGSPKPTICFMHLLQPHVPWSYLPSGRRYAEDGNNWQMLDLTTHGTGGDRWGHDELEVMQSQQRYLLQLMYVDRLLGQLIARMKETGQYDRSLLVVTADHGISFRANQPRRLIVDQNRDEILSIPLFIKKPGQHEGGVSDRAVESVDILPTVADILGINLHGKCDGWSVFDSSHPDRQQRTYTEKDQRFQVDSSVIVDSAVPREIRQRFGDSADPLAIYRIGPHPELVGRKVDSLKLSDLPPAQVNLYRYGNRADEAADIQIPCLYEGSVRSPRQKPDASTIVAIAIDGTIQAVTRTYQQAGFLDQWAAMVSESAFRQGDNDVKFYTVEKTASAEVSLVPCAVRVPTPEELRIRKDAAPITPPH